MISILDLKAQYVALNGRLTYNIDQAAIEGAIIGVCREHRFRHYQHGLEITGLCEDCRKEVEQDSDDAERMLA